MKVRIRFTKNGAIRFLGHLDIMRYFQKTIRRAHIDVAYTTGYSPHQIMSFAAPLGVGLTSDGEYMDIECDSVTTSEDMMEKLNRSSVEGIRILSVKELPKEAENAMASVAAAAYQITFRKDREPQFDYRNGLDAFLEQSSILFTKETKKGTAKVDLKPGIYEMRTCNEGIYLLVDASSSGNIKPLHVIEALAQFYGETLKENAIHVHRIDTYTSVSDDNGKRLISMSEIGSLITTPHSDEERIRIATENLNRKKEAIEEANRLREQLLMEKKAELEEWNRKKYESKDLGEA